MNDITSGNITISGLRALEEELLRYSDKMVAGVLNDALKEGAMIIRNEAKANVRDSFYEHRLKVKGVYIWIQPGNLRKSISVKKDTSGTRSFKLNYEVFVRNKETWYWKFVEFGTSKMEAQAFMRNAFEDKKELAVEVVKDSIEKYIENDK